MTPWGLCNGLSPEQRSRIALPVCRDKAAAVELEFGQPDHGSGRGDGGGARDLLSGPGGAALVFADGRSLVSDGPAVVLGFVSGEARVRIAP